MSKKSGPSCPLHPSTVRMSCVRLGGSTQGQTVIVTLTSLKRHLKLSGPAFHVVDDEKGASQCHTEWIAQPVLKTRPVCVLHTSLLLETHKLVRPIRLNSLDQRLHVTDKESEKSREGHGLTEASCHSGAEPGLELRTVPRAVHPLVTPQG